MILCVCTGITEGKLRWAVQEGGATCAGEAFDVLGLRPDCGRCRAYLEAAVRKVRAGEDVREEAAPAWGCGGRCRPAWGAPAAALAG
ncbi:MAG: (2Fe-2S)-binding protein [Holophaga sp.]|nr:(2Fe-2S)-binding protein [Holophaga sp.]